MAWANVKNSWQRGYLVFTATAGSVTTNFSIYEKNTSGALFDNLSIKELTMTDAGIGTVTCNGTSTARVFTLNPASNVGGVPGLKYNVTAPAGYTIAPTQGTYGQSTSFTLTKTAGSAIGTGALTITLTDEVNTECTVTASVTDPSPCPCISPKAAATTAAASKTQTVCKNGTAAAYTATPATGVDYKWYGPLADTTSTLGTAIASATLATYTPTGTVLTTAGTKYYAVVINKTGAATCADTAFVILNVNKPNAGKDSTLVCSSGNLPGNVQLTGTASGGTWAAKTGNPAGATINSSGLVTITNATAQGKTFEFVYTQSGCTDTVKVIAPTCPQTPSCNATSGVGGTVFNDFNNNGVFNTSDSLGFAGIKVYAYNCVGVKIDSAVTDSKGKYVFTKLTAGDSLRIEFVKSSFPTWASPTYNGTSGRTDVQFVKVPNCSVNMGMINVADYCQTNPRITTSCYVNGATGTDTPKDVLIYTSESGFGSKMLSLIKLRKLCPSS